MKITEPVWKLFWSRHCTWWRHQMETFAASLAVCEENPPVTGGFPSQRPVTRSFDIFYKRMNKQLSKQSIRRWFETPLRSLWRRCNEISTWYTCFIQTSWQIRVKSSANVRSVCPLSCYTRSVFDIRHCDDYPQLTSTDGGRYPKPRQADYNVVNSFHFIWRSGTRRWHRLQMSCNYMIMSSNGNIFRITDLFWKETTGYRWISLTKANDAELWCFLWSAPEQTIEQTTRRRWFETTSRSLWHHCNDLV